MPQRNTPARRAMLAARAAEQRSRSFAFTPMRRRPRGHVGDWDPAGERQPIQHTICPAWMNRRTSQPHEHNREKARRNG